ncbi:MAG TPA: FixH family protein [Anaerolineales bacterium]|nr:FixH family protein [Anaerolineales bacterium]
MNRFFQITITLLFTLAIAFSGSSAVLADGEDGEHALAIEVNGYHVTLASEKDWKKGQNTIIVSIVDDTGLPVSNADVEILIRPKSTEHAVSEEVHGAPEATAGHGVEQGHSSMPGMEMDETAVETHDMPAHEETNLLSLSELGEDGIYVVEAHLESSGTHEVNVMFHANGEILQADFVVEIPEVLSKTVVLWSFVIINVVLITSAGMMKRQARLMKGQQ